MILRLRSALPAVMCVRLITSASDSVIGGQVTDEARKPVRRAVVKAAAGGRAISRYTQDDGRYEIMARPGTYDISADVACEKLCKPHPSATIERDKARHGLMGWNRGTLGVI